MSTGFFAFSIVCSSSCLQLLDYLCAPLSTTVPHLRTRLNWLAQCGPNRLSNGWARCISTRPECTNRRHLIATLPEHHGPKWMIMCLQCNTKISKQLCQGTTYWLPSNNLVDHQVCALKYGTYDVVPKQNRSVLASGSTARQQDSSSSCQATSRSWQHLYTRNQSAGAESWQLWFFEMITTTRTTLTGFNVERSCHTKHPQLYCACDVRCNCMVCPCSTKICTISIA